MASDGNDKNDHSLDDGKDNQGLFANFQEEFHALTKSDSLSDKDDEMTYTRSASSGNLSRDQIPAVQKDWKIDTSDSCRMYSYLMTSLKTLLSFYYSECRVRGVDDPQTLMLILQNFLKNFVNKVKTQEEKLSQIETEVQGVQVFVEARHKSLIEDHKNRLQRLISDYDKQLSTAEERSMNSRRQTTTLQIQLAKALSQVHQLEAQNEALEQNYGINVMQQMDELIAKNNCFAAVIANLKEKLYIKDNELEDYKEMVSVLQGKSKKEISIERNYRGELEIELAKERALIETLQMDLEEERQANLHLWSDISKHMQEIAILKSQLDSSRAEVIHRNHLLDNLRQETLQNVVNTLPKLLVKTSVLSDNSNPWTSSMRIAINNKEKEILNISRELAQNEIELSELSSRLQSKRMKLQNIEKELELTDRKITIISNQLKVKKDISKRLAINLKSITRSINNCLEKCNEKKENLEELKDSEKRKEEEALKIMSRTQEVKRRTHKALSEIKYAQEESKHLEEVFEQIKKQEEDLYRKCLLKQNHLDQLTKLLLSKVKLIKELEREIADCNAMTNEVVHNRSIKTPLLESPKLESSCGNNVRTTPETTEAGSNQDPQSTRQSTPLRKMTRPSPAKVAVDSSVMLSSLKHVPDGCDEPITIQQSTNFLLKHISPEVKKNNKKSRRKLAFPGVEANPIYISSPATVTLKNMNGISRKLIINQAGSSGPLTIDLNVDPYTVYELKKVGSHKENAVALQKCMQKNNGVSKSKEPSLNPYLSSGSSGFFSVHDDSGSSESTPEQRMPLEGNEVP